MMSGKREITDEGGDEDRNDREEMDGEEDSIDSSEDKKPSAEEKRSGTVKKRRRRRVISTLQGSKWQQTYQRLLAYRQEHGNCLVPNRYPPDPSLGAWVATQRRNYRLYKSGTEEPSGMTEERISSLEAIGFQWTTTDPRHEPWEVRYAALKEFVKKYGHAEIPMRWEENIQLSNWVSKQRQDYKLRLKGKSSRLTDERMKLLNDLGFKWHIPRKGRKIKLKSIPVVKRQSADAGEPSSGVASLPREELGAETGQNLTAGSLPPASASVFNAEGVPTLPFEQVPSRAAMPVAQRATVASVTSLLNGGEAPSLTQLVPNLNTAALLGLQPSNTSALDLGTLWGSQSVTTSGASNNTGSASAASVQPSASSGNNQASSFGSMDAGWISQHLNTSALSGPQPQPQQNTEVPASPLLPFQVGDLLSTLQQQQQQQQQLIPVSMPWSSNPSNTINIPGILLNVQPQVPASSAPMDASSAAQAMSALITSQLLNAAAAPRQQQQQQQHNMAQMAVSQPASSASFASLLANAITSAAQQQQQHGQQQQQELFSSPLWPQSPHPHPPQG